MKLLNSHIILSVVALNLVSAAAVPQPEPEAILDALGAPENATSLIKRETNGANCWRNRDAYSSYFRLSTWGGWDQDWGQGLWDNIKGRCGIHAPDSWWFAFEQGAPPTNGMAQVRMARNGYEDRCVQDAVWIASNAAGGAINGMVCWESNKWW